MKNVLIIAAVAASISPLAMAQTGACKGGLSAFSTGFNADVVGSGNAKCKSEGQLKFEQQDKKETKGIFGESAFRSNTGSSQSFQFNRTFDTPKEGEDPKKFFTASLVMGDGTTLQTEEGASGQFLSQNETIAKGTTAARVSTTGDGACKGGITGSHSGFNADAVGTGAANCEFAGRVDFQKRSTEQRQTKVDEATYGANGGSIQSFGLSMQYDNGGYGASLTQGEGYQLAGKAKAEVKSETATASQGYVTTHNCFGSCGATKPEGETPAWPEKKEEQKSWYDKEEDDSAW